MSETLKFAVIGDPIDHSLSPQIHTAFARQFSLDMSYEKIHVTEHSFAEQVNDFFVNGGTGLNVTAPLKQLAFDYAELVSDNAMNATAVNTLKFYRDDIVFGDNTDGVGLVRDLQGNLGVSLRDANILILGAGGAVRGCLGAILKCQPQSVSIHNRTRHKALALIQDMSHLGVMDVLPGKYTPSRKFDVVINATSASIGQARPDIDHRYLPNAVCYDMVYGQAAAAFTKWALAQGAKSAHDGLGMLVEQAAESFYLWHEQRPDTALILADLRNRHAVNR